MATQVEIARRAGLAPTTVNKILMHYVEGKKPPYARETIQKVLEIARALGFDLEKLRDERRRRHPVPILPPETGKR